jgi:DNA-directed RNA polymerase specialized sigma24 family protein
MPQLPSDQPLDRDQLIERLNAITFKPNDTAESFDGYTDDWLAERLAIVVEELHLLRHDLNAFFRLYADVVSSARRRVGKNVRHAWFDTDDYVQVVYLNLVKSRESAQPHPYSVRPFVPWIDGVIRNVVSTKAKKVRRMQKREPALGSGDGEDAVETDPTEHRAHGTWLASGRPTPATSEATEEVLASLATESFVLSRVAPRQQSSWRLFNCLRHSSQLPMSADRCLEETARLIGVGKKTVERDRTDVRRLIRAAIDARRDSLES